MGQLHSAHRRHPLCVTFLCAQAKSTDALKKNASDPRILATIADLFWRNRKVENARSWFKR